MKKYFLFVPFILLFGIFFLTGCSDNKENDNNNISKDMTTTSTTKNTTSNEDLVSNTSVVQTSEEDVEGTVKLNIYYTLFNPKTNELISTFETKPDYLENASESKSYDYNTYVDLCAKPKEGYTFVGWYIDNQVLSNNTDYKHMMWDEDVTIEARFKYTLYDLVVWSNNYNLGQVIIREGNNQIFYNEETLQKYYEESTTIVAYSKTDTRFLGWYDENNKLVSTNPVYTFNMISRNYTLEAKWNNFNITYDLNGGINNASNPTYYNVDMSNITLLDPTRDGYTFQGWEYNDNVITEINTASVCHIRLTALWIINKYTVTLDNQATGVDITGIISGNAYEFDSQITLTATNIPSGKYLLWYCNELAINTGDSCEFKIPCKDVTIKSILTETMENIAYTREGNKIYFGTYPQTEVEATTENGLSSITYDSTWTSYEYYIESEQTDFMYYKDIDIDNNGTLDYRGVYFTQYRPYYCIYTLPEGIISNQAYAGYVVGKIHWFVYEPIEWDILKESDGEALIITNLILDSQEYYSKESESQFLHNGGNGYSNNYELSNIRKFLNDNFYKTAFKDLQKSIIEITEVDNSLASTGDISNDYVCNNTSDKIFILSLKELKTYYVSRTSRQAKGTDYSRCQGLCVDRSNDNGCWWLRSPNRGYTDCGYSVDGEDGGILNGSISVCSTYYGVRPTCNIIL